MELNLQVKGYFYSDMSVEDGVPMVNTSIFIGDEDQPIIDKTVTFESQLKEYIEVNLIPNGTLTDEYRNKILNDLNIMKQTIEKKIEEVHLIPNWTKRVY